MRNPEACRPVGRPSLGITKKVSLTLSAEEWTEIEASGLTVAAFLKKNIEKAPVAEAAPVPSTFVADLKDPINYQRSYVEERWEIHLRMADDLPSADVLEAAKNTLMRNLYPRGAEFAIIQTHEQYECPFTGKRYGSMKNLVSAAIPHLIHLAADKKHKEELSMIREREKAPKYLMDMR